MEPIHVKEALSFLYRVNLFAIQNERDASLQYAIESTAIRLKKQTSILIFFHR